MSMKARSDQNHLAIGVLFVLLLVAVEAIAVASWRRPQVREIASPNGQFEAVLTPALREQPAHAEIFAREGDQRTSVWALELVNPATPVRAWLADDGQRLITADDWYQAGYGENVIVLYSPDGLLARYSLEELVPVEQVSEYLGFVVESRFWRIPEFERFAKAGDRDVFLITLEYQPFWLAFDLDSGQRVEPDEADIARWNQELATRVVEMVERWLDGEDDWLVDSIVCR